MTGHELDFTHDPGRRSFVASANQPGSDFPLQNLPLGVFRAGVGEPRVGVAIGDQILDLKEAIEAGLLSARGALACACYAPALNDLMKQGSGPRQELRRQVHELLREGSALAADGAARARVLHDASTVTLLLPAEVGDYTDFYASIHHATNVGAMFRPDNPLLPNYKWVPIGYHGRASSVVVSGAPVARPRGQAKPADQAVPAYGPSRRLDYELEVGAWIGPGNALGAAVPIGEAEEQLFGLCLLNDWSARDVQAWEYQPLGPFLAKNFLTTVSPWVVTREALAPFRVPAAERPAGDPEPLPYLDGPGNRAHGGFGLTLEVYLETGQMRAEGRAPHRLSRGDFRRMYWTVAQLITHHASNGCNLRPGDLLGSGTVSGPEPSERGCLLELSTGGKEPLTLPTGETRTFLVDGDAVIFRGRCERPGAVGIGFGECRGLVTSSPA